MINQFRQSFILKEVRCIGRMIYTGEDTGLKSANNQKIIAISLLLLGSIPVWSGLGGLQVNSALGEPFSGTVVVTGDEAKAALKGKPTVSGANLQVVKVTAQGKNAVVHLRSPNSISEPMLSFSLVSGNQGRQYTALLDPRSYDKRKNSKDKDKSKNQPKYTSQRNPSEARARAALNNAFASDAAVGEYQVDKNETLMDVARKVRPQGLTVAQTMHALVIANPHAFKNGNPDVMYQNAKLKIPSAAQLARLAKLKKGSVVNIAATIPDEAPEKRNVPQIASAKEENGTGTKNDNTNSAIAQTGTANTSAISASAPVIASDVVATTASAASASSVVVAESVEPKPASAVKPAQPEPTPVESVPAVEEESLLPEWWPYALGGVAGVLLIAVLIWMRSRKKKADSDEYDDEDEDYEEQDDDEDDDIVFEETPVLSDKPTINSDVVNKEQETAEAITAKATAVDKAVDDWSWLTEDEIPTQDMPNLTSLQAEEAKIDSFVHTPNTGTVKEETSIDNEDWLNFNYDNKPLVSDTGKAKTSAAEPKANDLSWLEQLEEAEKFEEVQQTVNTNQPKILKERPVETVKAGFDDATASSDLKWDAIEKGQQPKSEDITAGGIFSAAQSKQIDDKIQLEKESFSGADKADQQTRDLSQVEKDSNVLTSQPDTRWYRDKPIPQWNVDFRANSKSELIRKKTVNPAEQKPMSETVVPQNQQTFASKDNVVSADVDWDALSLDKEEPTLSADDEKVASQIHQEKVTSNLSSDDIGIGLDYEDPSLSLNTEDVTINLDHGNVEPTSKYEEVGESFNYEDPSLSLNTKDETINLDHGNAESTSKYEEVGESYNYEDPSLSLNTEDVTINLDHGNVEPTSKYEEVGESFNYEDPSLSLNTKDETINLDHGNAESTSKYEEVGESYNNEDPSLSLADDSASFALDYENQVVKSIEDDNIPEVVTFDEKQTSQSNHEKNDLSSLDFTLSDDFEISAPSDIHIYEEEKSETHSAHSSTSVFATGTGVQEWENEKPKTDQPLTPEQMAVPLQAKLELAKMYLEMDDAVTARQTLRELVEEANGVILTEAQKLLYQLGG